MFGIIRPCRHRLSAGLHADWLAHLCGLCLTLRDEHGQLARVVTNYDGLIISVLVEAQTPRADQRREAGPCPLRGMRAASVARGEGAQLAAAVSLVLAAAKVDDHVEDRDGAFGRRPVAAAARRVAARWAAQGSRTGSRVGFDTAVLTEAVDRQGELERAIRPGDSALLATEPAELATAAAFARTAELAGRPGNAAPLAEAGRLFGRVAHLLDAVEDHAADAATGAWNPLLATGTGWAEARRLCDDAVLGVEPALREAEFANPALVHALLVHELRQAVRRAFGHGPAPGHAAPSGQSPAAGPGLAHGRGDRWPGDGAEPGGWPDDLAGNGDRPPGGPAAQQPPPGWIGRGPAPQQHPHQVPPGWGRVTAAARISAAGPGPAVRRARSGRPRWPNRPRRPRPRRAWRSGRPDRPDRLRRFPLARAARRQGRRPLVPEIRRPAEETQLLPRLRPHPLHVLYLPVLLPRSLSWAVERGTVPACDGCDCCSGCDGCGDCFSCCDCSC